MKIFILENNTNRIEKFKKYITDHTLHVATNVTDAKIIHEEHAPFDSYFLDHDLGDEVCVDSEHWNTGAQFSKWLVEHGVTGKAKIIVVHSMNPSGAKYMVETFDKARWIPFPTLFG